MTVVVIATQCHSSDSMYIPFCAAVSIWITPINHGSLVSCFYQHQGYSILTECLRPLDFRNKFEGLFFEDASGTNYTVKCNTRPGYVYASL